MTIWDGGIGRDTLTGGGGQDTFHFSGAVTSTNADFITAGDFNFVAAGIGGDIIDIKDIIGYAAGPIEDFVQVTQVGANSIIKVDANGLTGGTVWTTVVTVNGVNLGTDETALVTSGNLVVV